MTKASVPSRILCILKKFPLLKRFARPTRTHSQDQSSSMVDLNTSGGVEHVEEAIQGAPLAPVSMDESDGDSSSESTSTSESSDSTDSSSSSDPDEDPDPDGMKTPPPESNQSPDDPPPAPQKPRRYPDRNRQPPGEWWVSVAAEDKSSRNVITAGIQVSTGDEPTLREAMSTPPDERALWIQAIEEEIDSLNSKGTWSRDHHPASTPLPTHVVLKVKRNADGTVDRLKARIVAGGNFQKHGTDYFDTYAPVVDFALVRLMLYMAMCHGMEVGQADIKTAFLNGSLDEDVWVVSPRGIPGHPPVRHKLHKSLYGLKQAHLAWHSKLVADLQGIGFRELPSAPCVFMRKPAAARHAMELRGDNPAGAKCSFILVYVDDLLVVAPSKHVLKAIMQSLHQLYEMREMSNVEMFLGVELKWSPNRKSLHMSQSRYASDMVRRYGMQDSKPTDTPMVASFFAGLDAEKAEVMADVELDTYRSIIGSLLFLARMSRPDITTAVAMLARYSHCPTAYCMRAAKRVLRYVNSTLDVGVTMDATTPGQKTKDGCDFNLVNGFVDSDHANDTANRKSRSGFIIKVGTVPCIWGSKKQTFVSLSTCEAEFYAIVMATKEVLWFQRVLRQANFASRGVQTPLLRSDNQSAIQWCVGERDPRGHAKQVGTSLNFIRDTAAADKLRVEYVETIKNDADMFTKPLGPLQLGEALARIGIGPA